MRTFSIFFIIILTLFSLFLRLYRIEEPNYYYFDEVYHAVTAKAYSDNNPAAYDPFAPAPKEGTAYDWLHPPLAKLVQALSIKVLGDEPLGWRLPSAVFGTAIVPSVFILSFILFGPVVAVFASTVVAFENLSFVMSRITMNDVFVTFFIVNAITFLALYLKSYRFKFLILCSIFLGFAVASKWTGFYAILIALLAVFVSQILRKKLNFQIVSLIFIPIIIYLGSYGQFWLQGNKLIDFVELNKQIWWYQNRGDLQHSYGTTALQCAPQGLAGERTWCPWILNARGVYFSYEEYGDNLAGYIYALGNPIVFWSGVIAVAYLLGKYFDTRNLKLLLIVGAYGIFWVPWVFSPRIMFLYHYLPAIPFLAISLGVALGDIYKSKFKYLSILALLVIIGVFFYFFPISSGWPIPKNDINKYMWLKSWR